MARNYLDVEQVRFGDRLRVVQDIDEGCADCEVPPLLVQPLVENAIKHGIATLVEGGEISMRGRRSQRRMRFVIENPFDPEAPSTRRNGIGLANVRNRLDGALRRRGAARYRSGRESLPRDHDAAVRDGRPMRLAAITFGE